MIHKATIEQFEQFVPAQPPQPARPTLEAAVQAQFEREKDAIAALTRHPVKLDSPEEGRYRIFCEDTEVARFRLRRSLQCSGIAVPYGVVVAMAYRGRGIGQILERLRLRAAKEAGFGIALMTTRADNAVQIHVARKNGWVDAGIFTNGFTGHQVQLWLHNLQSTVVPPAPLTEMWCQGCEAMVPDDKAPNCKGCGGTRL